MAITTGRSVLHTMAAYYPDKPEKSVRKDMAEFVRLFARFYPCHVCADHLTYSVRYLYLYLHLHLSTCLSIYLLCKYTLYTRIYIYIYMISYCNQSPSGDKSGANPIAEKTWTVDVRVRNANTYLYHIMYQQYKQY